MLYHHIAPKTIIADAKTAAFWYPNAQHGGPLAGLLVELVLQKMPAPNMHPGRLYLSIIRPVMTGELSWEIELVKAGKNIQQVKVSLYQNKKLVVHGTLLLYLTRPSSPKGAPMALPDWAKEEGSSPVWPDTEMIHFAKDVSDVKIIRGKMLGHHGEGAAWIDVGVNELLDHLPLSPYGRTAVVADFSNALSSVISVDQGRFINADLSIEFLRASTDKALMLSSKTYSMGEGSGVVDGQIYDQKGLVAFCRQTILLDRGDS
jgi:acyl-coenzyme A thioesterase PaaI-like protein